MNFIKLDPVCLTETLALVKVSKIYIHVHCTIQKLIVLLP